MQSNKPKISERVEALELSVENLSAANLGMAQALENQRRVVVSLAEKMDAIFYLSSANQPITEEAVDARVIDLKEKELKAETEQALTNGDIKPAKVVGNQSFVVVRELDKDTKKVIQPRAQIALAYMPDEVKDDFLGKKKGDKIENGNVIIEIIEVYDFVKPEGK